jgi:MFS family permease
VGASLVVAVSATSAGGVRPRPLVLTGMVLAVAGISLAGVTTDVPLWVLALLLAGVGIGIGNTGSLGMLVQAVPIERIVTAIVVWSQVGIIGYLLGPLAGAAVAGGLGFPFVGIVVAAAAVAVALLLRADPRPAPRSRALG